MFSRRYQSARVAFTLIEILVVLAILAGIAAMILPVLTHRAGVSSREDVTQVLDSAVAQAIARSARTGSLAAVTLSPSGENRVNVVVCDIEPSDAGSGDKSAQQPVVRPASGGYEEVVGGFKVGTASQASAGVASGSAILQVSTELTTLALVAPDGTIQPLSRGVIRLGEQAAMHTVRVDGFGIVHLDLSGGDATASGDGGGERSLDTGAGSGSPSDPARTNSDGSSGREGDQDR